MESHERGHPRLLAKWVLPGILASWAFASQAVWANQGPRARTAATARPARRLPSPGPARFRQGGRFVSARIGLGMAGVGPGDKQLLVLRLPLGPEHPTHTSGHEVTYAFVGLGSGASDACGRVRRRRRVGPRGAPPQGVGGDRTARHPWSAAGRLSRSMLCAPPSRPITPTLKRTAPRRSGRGPGVRRCLRPVPRRAPGPDAHS